MDENQTDYSREYYCNLGSQLVEVVQFFQGFCLTHSARVTSRLVMKIVDRRPGTSPVVIHARGLTRAVPPRPTFAGAGNDYVGSHLSAPTVKVSPLVGFE